jgi:hypothetical protein
MVDVSHPQQPALVGGQEQEPPLAEAVADQQ